jgi:hypothetical protein
MVYIGKVWLKEPMQTKKIAHMLGLEDIVFHRTNDITGIMQWRGGNVLVLLHLEWGDINDTEKVMIYVHHLEYTEISEFFKLMMEIFRDIAVEISMSQQGINYMTEKEISNTPTRRN